MARRLGPRVTIAAMAPQGVEMAFGAFRDAQFGPVVVVSAGGVMLEWMDDKVFATPPFGPARARRLIDRLKIARLLEGRRGAPPADIAGLAAAFAWFSVMITSLDPLIAEMDLNPVIAGPGGAIAIDALVMRA